MSEEENVQTGEQIAEAAAPVENAEYGSQNSGQSDGNVPLEALQAERAQRQTLQEELRAIKDHLTLMQSQQSQPQQKPAQEEEGLNSDDVLTYGDLKKILAKKENEYQMSLKELQMTQKHPDYEEVISKYLPEVLKQNPSLRKSLQQSQDYELAYYLAKNSDVYKAEHKKAKRNEDAEKIIQNAQQSGSLSSIGGTSPVNQAKRYKEMSDEEFMKVANRNAGHF